MPQSHSGLSSTSRVVAVAVDGHTRVTTLRSEAPVALRACPDAIYVVASGAGPLEGDIATLEISAQSAAELRFRSTGASLVMCGGMSGSRSDTKVEIASDASVEWAPEPTVVTARARHQSRTQIAVAEGGKLIWHESIVLGRNSEEPGDFRSRIDLDVGDIPILRSETVVGFGNAAWRSAGNLGDFKATGSVVVVDRSLAFTGERPSALPGAELAIFDLGLSAFQVSAAAHSAAALRSALAHGVKCLSSGAQSLVRPRLRAISGMA